MIQIKQTKMLANFISWFTKSQRKRIFDQQQTPPRARSTSPRQTPTLPIGMIHWNLVKNAKVRQNKPIPSPEEWIEIQLQKHKNMVREIGHRDKMKPEDQREKVPEYEHQELVDLIMADRKYWDAPINPRFIDNAEQWNGFPASMIAQSHPKMTDDEIVDLVKIPVHSGADRMPEWEAKIFEALKSGRTTVQDIKSAVSKPGRYLGGRWLHNRLNQFSEQHPEFALIDRAQPGVVQPGGVFSVGGSAAEKASNRFQQAMGLYTRGQTLMHKDWVKGILDNNYDDLQAHTTVILPAGNSDRHVKRRYPVNLGGNLQSSMAYYNMYKAQSLLGDAFPAHHNQLLGDYGVETTPPDLHAVVGKCWIKKEGASPTCTPHNNPHAPDTLYIAHVWGINLEGANSVDYKKLMPGGRLDDFPAYEARMKDVLTLIHLCIQTVQTKWLALSGKRLTVRIPLIGMGEFLRAVNDEATKTKIQQLFGQMVDRIALECKAYADIQVADFDGLIRRAGFEFKNAEYGVGPQDGNLFKISDPKGVPRNYLMFNAWDNFSFIGNNLNQDWSVDGKMAAAMGGGGEILPNTSFISNPFIFGDKDLNISHVPREEVNRANLWKQ
jgi:hypothetical protein